MKSSRRLGPIAKLAKQRERTAASHLGDSLRQADLQQKQLDDLIHYRDEYVAGFKAAGKAGLSSVQLRDYQLFLSRLESAIQQQQQKLVLLQIILHMKLYEKMLLHYLIILKETKPNLIKHL